MLLKVDCLPNAVGKQPPIRLINLRRKWTLFKADDDDDDADDDQLFIRILLTEHIWIYMPFKNCM